MKFLAAIPLLLGGALAQSVNNTYVDNLISVLTSANLTLLASALSAINGSSEGNVILGELSDTSRHWTVFAPTDSAFNTAFPGVTNFSGQATGLSGPLAYHIVSGNFTNVTNIYPNVTIGRTLLNGSFIESTVHLEGNLSQVVGWAKFSSDNKTHVLNQNPAVTVVGTTQYMNLAVNVIDNVLAAPGNFSSALAANNLTLLTSVLQAVTTNYYDASTNTTMNITALDLLNTYARGFTLFAPSDAALTAVASTLASVQGNATLLWTILGNHILNGTTVYSPALTGKNFTSASGETLRTGENSTTVYVTSNSTTAQVVTPDVLLQNGVMHVIDHVLLNGDSNAGAASSAFASATSAAASAARTTETGPVGVPTGNSGSGSGSGGSGGGSGKSAAVASFDLPIVSVALVGAATLFAAALTLV